MNGELNGISETHENWPEKMAAAIIFIFVATEYLRNKALSVTYQCVSYHRTFNFRALTQAVLMTGCDLIASAKPWAVQTETVKVIFEEFYEQVQILVVFSKTSFIVARKTRE